MEAKWIMAMTSCDYDVMEEVDMTSCTTMTSLTAAVALEI